MSNEAILAKIKELEQELSRTEYNKKTQFHIGLTKAKIANLKEKMETLARGKKAGTGYTVRKTGDATVVLLGFPSVGKSTLLNTLTNAHSPVAAYAFTTLTCIPGLLEYNHAKIQILDVPGIVKGAASGTGRGKEVLQVIRSADLILMLIDVFSPEQLDVLQKEVWETGVRINQKKPDVKITKTGHGGVRVGSTVKLTKLNEKTIADMLKEMKINNADVLIREDISADQLIDIIDKNRIYLPAITVLNKVDLLDENEVKSIARKIKADIMISAESKINIEQLKELIFRRLDLMRLYLKEINKKPDLDEPMIITKGSTLRNVCEKLHRDFVTKFKFARVWGKSVRFEGQKVLRLDHSLQDKDIVELHLK